MLKWNARRATGTLLIAWLSSVPIAVSQAAEFADDLEVDPTEFGAGSFDNSSGDWSIETGADGLRLQIATDNPEQPGSLYIDTRDINNSIGIDVTFSDESEHTGSSTVFLQSRIFRQTEFSEDGAGDVEMEIAYGRNADATYDVSYCLLEQMADGSRQPLGDFGTEFCDQLTSGVNADGVRRSIDISSDIASGSVTISFDDVSRTINSPVDVFPAVDPRNRIQLWMNTGNIGNSVATLHEIRNGGETLNLANYPTSFTRYTPLYDVDGIQRTASHANGMLTLTAEATELNDFGNILRLQNPTDYLESTFTISSASTLGNNGRMRVDLNMGAFNDLADGGVDGQIGDVEAFLGVEVGANGGASVFACASRRNDPAGEDQTGLFANGDDCAQLPLLPVVGEPVRASIALDRENSTLTFRANEAASVLQLDGPIFIHSDAFANIGAFPRDLATIVLDIDEVRTSPTLLTDSESDSGATEPTPFPPAQTEPVAADSTINFPYNAEAPLDFVDDFSQPTSQLSFNPSLDQTDAGIAFIDGALFIESTQSDPDNCCGDGRLRIQEDTDFVSARVSLSSESQLPIDDQARAAVRIDGVWYNDTQDGGFDDRGGDVFVELQLALRGDGRREASFCFSRRTGNGSNEPLNIVDSENCGTFDLIPQLDTEYDMSVAIERQVATMTFTFASETRVVDLGGTVFTAAQNERAINVQHQGSSGRAVGRIHSITTASGTIDIASNPPLIGPYRPVFAAQSPGREVSVVDGRLRIEVDSAIEEGNNPQFVSRHPSEYVAATVEVSSESSIDGGLVAIGVGGHMYNDIMDGGVGNGSDEGAVFSIVNLVFNDEGENFVEYCAFRSNTSDFSDSTELLSGGDDCLRFSTPVALDTPARVLIAIDRARGVLEFGVNDEIMEHTIATGIFAPHRYFNGVRARAEGGSHLIGFADDLAYSENPVPLSESSTQIGFAADDGAGGDVTDGDSGGSSGGGGCSIAGGGGGLGAPMLLLVVMFLFRGRRVLVRCVFRSSACR